MRTANKARDLKGQAGQAAVLAALCMFTMIVFVALATNMGILASDRIRMQNVADATAYAGALEQARILNKVRLHERAMVKRAAGIRWIMTLEPLPIHLYPYTGSCSTSNIPETILNAYENLMVAHRAEVVTLLRRGQNSAERAAQLTAQKNMEGLGFGRSFESYRVYSDSPTFFLKSLLEPPDEGEIVGDSKVSELSNAIVPFNYAIYTGCHCHKKCCIFPLRSSCVDVRPTKNIKTWWYKTNTGSTVYFPIRLVGTPLKRFFDVNRWRGYFGARGPKTRGKRNNQISVFSAAKPYDGGIAPNPANFGAIGQTQSVRVLFSIKKNLYTWDGIVDTYESFYEEHDTRYRARLVGLHERVGRVSGGGPPIAGFQQLFTAGPDPHQLTSDEYGLILH